MILKTTYGSPIDFQTITTAVEEGALRYFSAVPDKGSLIFTCKLEKDEIVYGLGETTGRLNKRGSRFISFNTDTADHNESNPSIYASHNFLLIEGSRHFGVFFDTPGRCTFEIDWQNSGIIKVICENPDMVVYTLENDSAYAVARELNRAIGRCYLPPLWAFGFGQSRFGYKCQQDFEEVMDRHEKAGIPLDYICMDIDYMDGYADFTVHPGRFPDLKAFAESAKERGIHLVPIVDAGIKIQPGDPVYESGVKDDLFCRNKEGGFFKAAVWPGMTHFPDFLNPDARRWFGDQYRFYTHRGIEGFWNDMNEPAIFYSEYAKGPKKLNWILDAIFSKQRKDRAARNLLRDYKSFFHRVDGRTVCHYDVHNVFGYLMTRASGEGLDRLLPGRYLLFSRSSYIGAGRYGGIWTGDNSSTWEHLLLILRQLPGLNMCGFLYSGSDTGGFMGNCTRELLLRWLAVSAFTPLMRDHSGMGTHEQECYAFGDTGDFVDIVSLRYRLLPYIYSEYMKAALTGDLYIKPLGFHFPEDPKAAKIEDQLIVGGSLMMTPIIQEGQTSRTVYLPEAMTMVKYDGQSFTSTPMEQGEHTICAELNEVVFFILKNRLVPIGKAITNTSQADFEDLQLLGDGTEYALYCDDGLSKACSMDSIRILHK